MPIADSPTVFSVPLAVLLIPFGFFAILYLVYTFFNLYHLVRYGIANMKLNILIGFYSLGSFLIMAAVIIMLAQYDWSQSISLTDIIDLFNQPLTPTTL